MFGAGALIITAVIGLYALIWCICITAARADEAEQKAWEQFAHGDCFPHPLIRRPPFGGLRTNPGADTTAAVQSRNGSGRFSLASPFHAASDSQEGQRNHG